MATDTSNSTFNSSYEKVLARLPSSECIPWLVVLITECLAVVILNIITIIVFVKQRQLQRQSTYLIIHLAIVDLLVGAVSWPIASENEIGKYCDLWESNIYNPKSLLGYLFLFSSLFNLAFISLERLHATLRPFKHRVIKKWVYGVVIAVLWLITTVTSVKVALDETSRNSALALFLRDSICLFAICVLYLLIVIKVRCGPHLQHHGATNRERKLTGTLLLVTLASLFFWLPLVIFNGISYFGNKVIKNYSLRSYFHIYMTLLTLAVANSLANPIVYAIRMPEFRTGVVKIFRRGQNHTNPADLPLRNL